MINRMMVKVMCLSVVLTGCVTAPTQQDLANAYYGEQPQSLEYAKATVTSALGNRLKDPSSLQIQNFRTIGKGHYGGGLYKYHYGWVYPFSYNAKNSFGGYVGFQEGYAVFQNDTLTYLITIPRQTGEFQLPDVIVNGPTGAPSK